MKLKTSLIGAAVIAGIAFSASTNAAVMSFDATADTVIQSDGTVNGTGQGLFVGQNGVSSKQRGIILFDLNALTGATINSVTLELVANAQGYGSSAASLDVHTMNTAWNEASVGGGGPTSGGGSGFAANPGDATWTDSGNAPWTAGGDFNATASASMSTYAGLFSTTSITGAGLVADVQNWADGAANYGWMLIGNEIALGSSVRWSSSENALYAGPTLVIDYSPAVVPVPAAAWLFGSGLLGLVGIARRKHA